MSLPPSFISLSTLSIPLPPRHSLCSSLSLPPLPALSLLFLPISLSSSVCRPSLSLPSLSSLSFCLPSPSFYHPCLYVPLPLSTDLPSSLCPCHLSFHLSFLIGLSTLIFYPPPPPSLLSLSPSSPSYHPCLYPSPPLSTPPFLSQSLYPLSSTPPSLLVSLSVSPCRSLGLTYNQLKQITHRAFEHPSDEIQTQKVSSERLFILTRAHNVQIFGEMPFVKSQNDT